MIQEQGTLIAIQEIDCWSGTHISSVFEFQTKRSDNTQLD